MIIQVGPYPEPLGGVSVYIKRMKEYLDSLEISNQVWDISAVPKGVPNVVATSMKALVLQYLFRRDIKLIHYHLYTYRSKILVGYLNKLFPRRIKVLTIHNESRNMFQGFDTRKLCKALNSFDAIICVRSGDCQYLINQGIRTAMYEIPAYIAPTQKTNQEILPGYVSAFLKQHSFIITANASGLRFHNGCDLYGLDLCIDLMYRLKQKYPERQIGFAFALAEITDVDYLHRQQEKVRELGLQDDFLLMIEKCEFYPLIQKSQLFIRPTNTDGYSISLAEAMDFNIPVVASDIVQRPSGTVLFKTRDGNDLFEKTATIIENYPSYLEQATKLGMPNNADQIWQLYRDLLNSQEHNIKSRC